MNSEDGVGTRRVHIKAVVSCSSLLLAFEEAVKGFLFVAALGHRQATHLNLAIGIVLHSDVRARLVCRRRLREHIEHELVVNFDKRDLDGDLVVETAADFREDLVYRSWDKPSVLVVSGGAGHGERLAGTGLTIAHDGSIEAVNDFVDSLLGAILKDLLLRSVMQ